jgi:hypothetical protein
MSLSKSGHAPGHLRDQFQDAVDEVMANRPVDRAIFGWLWNCTDQLPRFTVEQVQELGATTGTYASAARVLMRARVTS